MWVNEGPAASFRYEEAVKEAEATDSDLGI